MKNTNKKKVVKKPAKKVVKSTKNKMEEKTSLLIQKYLDFLIEIYTISKKSSFVFSHYTKQYNVSASVSKVLYENGFVEIIDNKYKWAVNKPTKSTAETIIQLIREYNRKIINAKKEISSIPEKIEITEDYNNSEVSPNHDEIFNVYKSQIQDLEKSLNDKNAIINEQKKDINIIDNLYKEICTKYDNLVDEHNNLILDYNLSEKKLNEIEKTYSSLNNDFIKLNGISDLEHTENEKLKSDLIVVNTKIEEIKNTFWYKISTFFNSKIKL